MSREEEQQEHEWERHLREGLQKAEEALRKQNRWQTHVLADLTRVAAEQVSQAREREREQKERRRKHQLRQRERHLREVERFREFKRRKRRAKLERLADTHPIEGIFQLFAGLFLFGLALVRPNFWWMIFPAFFLVQRGLRILAAPSQLERLEERLHRDRLKLSSESSERLDPTHQASERAHAQVRGAQEHVDRDLRNPDQAGRSQKDRDQNSRDQVARDQSGSEQKVRRHRKDRKGKTGSSFGWRKPAPQAAGGESSELGKQSSGDVRDQRLDAVCERIREELRTGPEAVRQLLHRPEETLNALQSTCRELTFRERELLAVLSPTEEERLDEEQERLRQRVENERDPIVLQRLNDALRALDDQRRWRAELRTSAARLDAEHTRITFALESIYTQMLRARAGDSASADLAGAGLRQSLERLGIEMGAVAEALEASHLDEAMNFSGGENEALNAHPRRSVREPERGN